MEAVNAFNAELQSLYDVKPPISKGKMNAVTKAALKGVKLYKHVVQSVEKFIQKCKSEYKIPGLYVIDSIIRQSRHQFGIEKDVFASRFARNLQVTFTHLYKCPDEDKSKVIRVLNLWQKNKIFTPEQIQPLFDLADPSNPIWESVAQGGSSEANHGTSGSNDASKSSSSSANNSGGLSTNAAKSTSDEIYPTISIKKGILDYDYDDDEEEAGESSTVSTNQQNNSAPSQPSLLKPELQNLAGLDALGNLLSNPEILRQLQNLQETMAAAAQQQTQPNFMTPEQERQRKLAELNKQEAAFESRLAQTVAKLPFAVDCDLPLPRPSEPDINVSSPNKDLIAAANDIDIRNTSFQPGQLAPSSFFQNLPPEDTSVVNQDRNRFGGFNMPPFPQHPPQPPLPPGGMDFNQGLNSINFPPIVGASENHMNQDYLISLDPERFKEEDRRSRDRIMKRSRSRSRSRRSRSRSKSRGNRNRRSRSRSRGRKRHNRSRSRSRDRREDREREKERLRRGLPPLKKDHLSICTTTIWVGHLSKLVSQEELSDTFGVYGDIVSIELIAPRGCAFIVMNRRQDACRALEKLRNTKLQGKAITLAWAPGKGVKGKEWKEYWEVEEGVSYIPWSKLRPDVNMEDFEDGGCIDEESVPHFLRDRKEVEVVSMELVPPSEESEELPPIVPPSIGTPTMMVSTPNIVPGVPPPNIATSMFNSLLPPLPEPVPPVAISEKQDTDARLDINFAAAAAAAAQTASVSTNVAPLPTPQPFGLQNPLGMVPVGVNMMVPPPIIGLQGMNSLAGMPLMPGLVPPPTSVPPPMGPPGQGLGPVHPPPLMSEPVNLNSAPNLHSPFPPAIPSIASTMLSEKSQVSVLGNNGSNNNNGISSSASISNTNSASTGVDVKEGRGKKRSRFDDQDSESPSKNSESQPGSSSPSMDQNETKKQDDRPLFDRLKSLAEGYGIVNNSGGDGKMDQSGNISSGLLGPRPGFGPPPLGQVPGSFGPRGSFQGGSSERIPSLFAARGPRPWMDVRPGGVPASNPFVNPNPFEGNPFIETNLSENPFERNPRIPNMDGSTRSFMSNSRGGRGRGFWGRDQSDRGGWRGRGRGAWRGRGGASHVARDEASGDDRDSRNFDTRWGWGRGPSRDFNRGRTEERDQDQRHSRERERARSRERGSYRDSRSRRSDERDREHSTERKNGRDFSQSRTENASGPPSLLTLETEPPMESEWGRHRRSNSRYEEASPKDSWNECSNDRDPSWEGEPYDNGQTSHTQEDSHSESHCLENENECQQGRMESKESYGKTSELEPQEQWEEQEPHEAFYHNARESFGTPDRNNDFVESNLSSFKASGELVDETYHEGDLEDSNNHQNYESSTGFNDDFADSNAESGAQDPHFEQEERELYANEKHFTSSNFDSIGNDNGSCNQASTEVSSSTDPPSAEAVEEPMA